MFNLLKLTRIAMAATFLAVAFAPSPAGAQQATGPTVTDKSPTGELAYWNSIKDSTDASNFKAYLENFPNGMFYDLALAKFTSLGGNATDLKPVAKGSSSASGNSSKPKAVMAKQKTVIVQKKVVLPKVWKKPRMHVAKRLVHKHVIHHKRLKPRKVDASSSDQFGSGRGGGSGGGGGGGGGGGWGH